MENIKRLLLRKKYVEVVPIVFFLVQCLLCLNATVYIL